MVSMKFPSCQGQPKIVRIRTSNIYSIGIGPDVLSPQCPRLSVVLEDTFHWKVLSTEKKTHNLKVENYVLFGGLSEVLSPRCSLSNSSEGLPLRGKRGARIYRSFCNKNQVEHQKITVD